MQGKSLLHSWCQTLAALFFSFPPFTNFDCFCLIVRGNYQLAIGWHTKSSSLASALPSITRISLSPVASSRPYARPSCRRNSIAVFPGTLNNKKLPSGIFVFAADKRASEQLFQVSTSVQHQQPLVLPFSPFSFELIQAPLKFMSLLLLINGQQN